MEKNIFESAKNQTSERCETRDKGQFASSTPEIDAAIESLMNDIIDLKEYRKNFIALLLKSQADEKSVNK
ncbi:MAG: hypothetical protein WCY05_07045, partial [Candidatus Omnitrophota bacterium]